MLAETTHVDPVHAALDEALDDEYKARATYRAVLDRFGDVRPFSNIVESEQRHIDSLRGQYRRLGLQAPPDRWAGAVEPPPTLEDACRQAVRAEIDNAAMYDRLLALVDDPEVAAVLANLRQASQQRHLPAFERCLERGGGPGGGHGRGGHGRS